MQNEYTVTETYKVHANSSEAVHDRVVTSENDEFTDYEINITPSEYRYWLINLFVRDGEHEYIDTSMIDMQRPVLEHDARKEVEKEYLSVFEKAEDEDDVWESDTRRFSFDVTAIRFDEHAEILKKYIVVS
tara:strand:+ start:1132 stop:1524 length:393 start_codon:yes stop_codon:yes gene_type:complete